MKTLMFLCLVALLAGGANADNEKQFGSTTGVASGSEETGLTNDHSILSDAYRAAKAAHPSRRALDDVVASRCNALVCVQIDEDGDFNIGTADGRSLLYFYPAEPWSSDIEISIDGVVWNLTDEHGLDCSDGLVTFVEWTGTDSSLTAHYTIDDVIHVYVTHIPVLFSGTTGAILTRTEVMNDDDTAHNIGVLYEYDTTVDGDDAAELYLGPDHLVNETCYDAPYAVGYWDAIPFSGDLVGRGTFMGGDAVTPDHLAFGQWGSLYDACWNYVCTGAEYGDSGVLYQWDDDMVEQGDSKVVATYYGVGEIEVQPGDLQISVSQPALNCTHDGVSPNPFEILINITNTGASTCSEISVELSDGTGPGGTGTVLSTNPQAIGSLTPGDNAAVSFTTMAWNIPQEGGCINFLVSVTSANCPANSFEFCVEMPACTCLVTCACFDMGDLARCNYPTVTNNPAHGVTFVAWLGDTINHEFFPNILNLDLYDDGVNYLNLPWMPCDMEQVEVTVTAGPEYGRYVNCGGALYLSGWKDGNLDGDFCDTLCDGTAPEWIVQDVFVLPGVHLFTFPDPGVLDLGVYDGIFRWRLSSQPVGAWGFGLADTNDCPGNTCGNYAVDFIGEVEDYIIADAQLDVELSSFEALPGDEEVTLRWTTASETGNERFEVLRDDAMVAHVASQGNGTTERQYQWTDDDVVNGRQYAYALIAVDINGNRERVGTTNATPSADAAVITEYALHQNYPNPFNPTTEITFDLVKDGQVKLSVYNLLGQEVAEVVNRTMDSGRHSIMFTADELPSGVYLYRLEAGEFTSQKKMVLIK